MIKIDQLETFITVFETGSINSAAQQLVKTQPAVSMTLKRLEESIGFLLFDRTNYRLKPTDRGHIYYQKAKSILDQMYQLQELSSSLTAGVEDKVSIAIEDTANIASILKKLQPLQSLFPNTELAIEAESRLNSLTRLAKEEVQLAITPWIFTFASEGDFESKAIKSMSMFYCIHKDLAATLGITCESEVTEQVLMQLPQIVPTEFSVKLNHAKIMKPIGRSIVKVNNLTAMLAALNAKLGWGPMTDSYWSQDMRSRFLRFPIDKNSSPISNEIRIVKNRYNSLGPAAKKIWSLI
ncbi:LysR family transcriptional regulator [Psychrosphaera sp.]|nr:LysR family transcriptional regulator [Psychrosphaera sp.]